MTTTPSASLAPWQAEDHFQAGDQVVVISSSGNSEIYFRVDSPQAHTVVVLGQSLHTEVDASTVRDPVYMGDFTKLRHAENCSACGAYVNGIRLLGEMNQREHLGRWSAAAHAKYAKVTAEIDWESRAFKKSADVPAWVRECTYGMLLYPEGPDLQLARLYDLIDWPALLAEHPGELVVGIGATGYGYPGLTWEAVVAAHRQLDTAGCLPHLDVDLGFDEQGRLTLYPSVLYIGAPAGRSVVAQVDALLPDYPFSDVWPGWSWCS